jgi:hypothetical protein
VHTRFLLPTSFCVLLTCGFGFAQSQLPSSPTPKKSTQATPGISARNLARLRPVVLQDLRALVAGVYNIEDPSAAYLEEEFQRCQFTPLTLGTLGPAVLVEAQPGHGKTNASMLNIYLPSHGSYRRIVEAEGFGPEIVPGPKSIPYLVFGWSFGVCHTKSHRYRYQSGKYSIDACNQETGGENGGSCLIESCEGSLPTFHDPWQDQSEPKDASAEEGPCIVSAALTQPMRLPRPEIRCALCSPHRQTATARLIREAQARGRPLMR